MTNIRGSLSKFILSLFLWKYLSFRCFSFSLMFVITTHSTKNEKGKIWKTKAGLNAFKHKPSYNCQCPKIYERTPKEQKLGFQQQIPIRQRNKERAGVKTLIQRSTKRVRLCATDLLALEHMEKETTPNREYMVSTSSETFQISVKSTVFFAIRGR